MENPFEIINERLERIEKLLKQIKVSNTDGSGIFEIMNMNQLTSYLGITKGYVYKLTSKQDIPFYKRGKMLYFDKEEINDWIKQYRVSTRAEIEQKAADYIMKHPLKWR